jgi:hypothetical protein
MKEIRRRTRVVGAFPDAQSCLNLAAARLRYIAGRTWSTKCYMNMRHSVSSTYLKPKPLHDRMCERFWTLPEISCASLASAMTSSRITRIVTR